MKTLKNLRNIRKITWLEWAGRPLSFHFWWIDLQAYYRCYRMFIGKRYKYVAVEGYGDGTTMMYRDKSETDTILSHIKKEIVTDNNKLENNLQRMERAFLRLWKLAPKLREGNFRKWSTTRIKALLSSYYNDYQLMIGSISTAILVAESLASKLRERLAKDLEKDENIELILRTLSTPITVSKVTEEELAFYRVLTKQGSKNFNKLFDLHVRKWCYIPTYTSYSAWTKEDFKKRMVSKFQANSLLGRIAKQIRTTEKEIEDIMRRHKFNRPERYQVMLLRKYLYWRINDETTLGLMTYSFSFFEAEICRRLYISPKQAKFLTVEELSAGLSHGKVSTDLIHDRMKHYLILISPTGVMAYSGLAAMKLRAAMRIDKSFIKVGRINKIVGTPANPGLVRGVCRIVHSPQDMKKVKKGDILVAPQTTPPLVPAMKVAGAIVTNEGGITSHAAIVSRELGIPCVIGTKIATKVFKDGDRVEVDATKGIVRKI